MLLLGNIINDLGWSCMYLMKLWVLVQYCRVCDGITLSHVALCHYVLCFLFWFFFLFLLLPQCSKAPSQDPSSTVIICVLAFLSSCIIFTRIYMLVISKLYIPPWQVRFSLLSLLRCIYRDASQICHILCAWNCFIPLLTKSALALFFQACSLASRSTPLLTFMITRSTTDCAALLLKIILLFSSRFNYFSLLFVIYSHFLAFFVNFGWFQRL